MLQLLACNCANKELRPEFGDNLLRIFHFQAEIRRSSVVPINVSLLNLVYVGMCVCV